MQSNNNHQLDWLYRRGITDEVLSLFNITTEYEHPVIGECIRIPFSDTHAKYRRDPQDARKPKYMYDAGGRVTLYGLPQLIDSRQKSVVITEGELDTLVLWSLNIPAVSSTGGAMSFQAEWAEALSDYQVYLCFDNDEAGANGMVKVLKTLPNASVILLPHIPNGKDISDYVARGGDFRALMDSALSDISPTTVEADKRRREPVMLPTVFHESYLDSHQQDLHRDSYTPTTYTGNDKILRAKSYPMTNLIQFNRRKAVCPWHNERTPSLNYYSKTNSAYCFGQCGRAYDSIDAYRYVHDCDFLTAVKELNKMV